MKKKLKKITNKSDEGFTNVRHIIKAKNGAIWLGGNSGLWRYDGKNFVGYVHEDSKGNIWTSSHVSSYWGIRCYEAFSLTSQTTLYTDLITEIEMCFGILEDADGNIWFGSLNGVYRYDGNTFTNFKADNEVVE